jgi:hypothetical protein
MANRHSAPATGFVGVLLAAGLIACHGSDSRVPTSPSGSPPAPSTPPPEVSDTLRGRVLDENDHPVGAAKVMTRPGPLIAPVSTFTAEDGRFTLTAPPQQYGSRQYGVWVSIERDGYESEAGSYLVQVQQKAPAPEQTLRLHRVLVIEPGASLPIRFLGGEPICGHNDGWACRRLRLRAPAPGTITVRIAGDPPDTFVLSRTWDAFPEFRELPIAVGSPSEEVSFVALIWFTHNWPQTMELRTSFEPRTDSRP